MASVAQAPATGAAARPCRRGTAPCPGGPDVRLVVAPQVAIGARRGEQRIFRRIGDGRLLEDRDRLGRLAVLLSRVARSMATSPSSMPAASMARSAAWASAIFPARALSTAASRCWEAVCAVPDPAPNSPTIRIGNQTIDRQASRIIGKTPQNSRWMAPSPSPTSPLSQR